MEKKKYKNRKFFWFWLLLLIVFKVSQAQAVINNYIDEEPGLKLTESLDQNGFGKMIVYQKKDSSGFEVKKLVFNKHKCKQETKRDFCRPAVVKISLPSSLYYPVEWIYLKDGEPLLFLKTGEGVHKTRIYVIAPFSNKENKIVYDRICDGENISWIVKDGFSVVISYKNENPENKTFQLVEDKIVKCQGQKNSKDDPFCF